MRVELWQRNLIAVFIGQLFSAMGFSFILPFIPLYVQVLGVKSTVEAAQWAGWIGAASALSMALTQPIWGNLADRYGRKPMVVRSMVGGAIVVSLLGLATSPLQLLILRFIQGTVTGVVAAATALVATGTPKARLGFSLGMMQVALFVGNSIGPLAGGLISDTLGYRAAFFTAGGLLFVGGLIVVFFVREKFTPPAVGESRPSLWADTRSLFALALFPALIAVTFMIQFGAMIISPVLSLFIGEISGDANVATVAGAVLAATGAVSALSAVVIGRWSDRVGHTKILMVCLLGSAVSYFPQGYVNQVWELLVLRMLLGVFLGGLMPTANALIAGIVPQERRGAAYGMTATANAVANGVGPISGAAIATGSGMRAVFLATGVLYALALGWVSLVVRGRAVPEPRRHRQAS